MIREAVISDYEVLKKLVYQIHELHYENRPDIYNDGDSFPKEYYYRVINDKSSYCYVYEENNKIVGVVIFSKRESSNLPIFKARKTYFIEDIVVDKEYKRKSIGKKLYELVRNKAKEEGIDVIELNVWAFNADAIKFYETMGMTVKNMIFEEPLSKKNK